MNSSKSNDPFIKKLHDLKDRNVLTDRYFQILLNFYTGYKNAEKNSKAHIEVFETFLPLFIEQFYSPHQFEPFHQRIRAPFDYYKFGMDFIRPLVDLEKSKVLNLEYVDKMCEQVKNKENVIFFANHQAEIDPQAISLLLEKTHSSFAEEMIFVAGDRVITDPLAIPFSMGRNLLCIFSKRYINTPIELKQKKQLHNQKTMKLMSQLLKEGGKVIYVAPSGGRDRKNETGEIEIAPFDPPSIEMFYLMAKKSKTPTHFYPLTLITYDLLPPPKSIQQELGEERNTKHSPIFMAFSDELNMEHFPGYVQGNKLETRKKRAEYIWNLVKMNYQKLRNL